MMSFMTTCCFPCLCEHCRAVVQADVFAQPARRPECKNEVIPFDDPALPGSPGGEVVADWNTVDELGRELQLTDGAYRCPRCGHLTLWFTSTGRCWDQPGRTLTAVP
jgi:hypothetical protein